MMWLPLVVVASWLALGSAGAADWRADPVAAPGKVTAVESVGAQVRVAIGRNW